MNIFDSVRSEYAWNPPGVQWMFREATPYRFVALQPIFDRHNQIFGYEALSRSGWDNRFTGNAETATQRMIEEWMLDGLSEITGNSPIFLNCTRADLLGDLLTVLPTTVVLEVLETVEFDSEVLEACLKLKSLNYKLALDDFQPSCNTDALVGLADYIKIDFRLSNKEDRQEILRSLKKKDILLIAEKIESLEEFEIAHEEGFHLFQGYYPAPPRLFAKRRILPS